MQVTLGGLEIDVSGWEAIVRDAARWCQRARMGDDLAICTSSDELRRAFEQQKTGVMLGLQDTLAIGTDLRRLDSLYGFGVRVVQLTYNRRNLVGDGCTEPANGALSIFGIDLLKELNRLGIVADLSHCGVATTNAAIERSERPVAFTHTGCAALNDHPRAKSDDQLRRLAAADGYVGIVALPPFLRPDGEAVIDDMIDHIAHAGNTVGLERVGIATDWGIWSSDFPAELYEPAVRHFVSLGLRPEDAGPNRHHALGEFVNWSDWPQLTRGLVRRGFDDNEIRGLLGENWLRYLDRAGVRA
jgi:membrane dipeptidase